jgi:SH3 domain protein
MNIFYYSESRKEDHKRGEIMKRLLILLLLTGAMFYIPQPCWGARAYVTDSFEITLRTGPSIENKIIAMLSSGQPVDVSESQGEWSMVHSLDGSKEGWVFSRYLISRLPWSVQAKSLKEENTSLQSKLGEVQSALNDAQRQRGELTSAVEKKTTLLEQTQKNYETLKHGAEGFLKLKKINEMNEASLKAARQELEKLRAEREEWRSSQMTQWFATGALVLLCGLLLGIMVGRQQKKRKFY